jgi:predicted TIM-barrel fold metal-dependent hydrolase
MDNRLIVVSVDSHAQTPPQQWAQYLEQRYHEHLPTLQDDNELYTGLMGMLSHRVTGSPEALATYDRDGAYQAGGYLGIWDPEVRLREMDREGIAGEFVYFGDHRAASMFHNVFNRKYAVELIDAGIRAYHRWAADTFGHQRDRVFLVGAGGTGVDLPALLDELGWIADHGFAGTFPPAFLTNPDLPPLFDAYWDPVWALCAERGLPLFVHAGYGQEQGRVLPIVERIKHEVDAAGGTETDLMGRLKAEVFTGEFFSDVSPRRPMWQLMLGGVFDRHPALRLVMTEVRSDWLPATLRHLDGVFERHRRDLPAKHSPTEYWHTHCITSLSFPHRAEVEMRHELGLQTLAFGRDYPHNESTWPNTKAWLRDAFIGVPENELRLILGENVIRVLGLDRARLAEVAARIGPTLEELTAGPPVDAELVGHFDLRGGYLKPAEGAAKIPIIDELVRADLAQAGITG